MRAHSRGRNIIEGGRRISFRHFVQRLACGKSVGLPLITQTADRQVQLPSRSSASAICAQQRVDSALARLRTVKRQLEDARVASN